MENVLDAVQQESGLKSRRSALLMGGAALAGLALTHKASAQTTAITDADILNFALNLEFLEAQFYAYATTGAGYTGTTTGTGTAGTVTVKANPKVPFVTPALQAFAMELAQDEANHVAFLQSALNANGANAAIAMPNIDLMTSFQTLATAAGIPNGSTFDPFASELNFLIGAFIFEDVGVTAYQGAAPAIQNSTYLDKAVGIHGVEAYHAGSIRQRIFAAGGSAQMLSQMVAATRAQLDGSTAAGKTDDVGVSTATVNGVSVATLVDADSNAMTFARTTTQVLSVVYGSTANPPTPGAFFPQGLNGTIK